MSIFRVRACGFESDRETERSFRETNERQHVKGRLHRILGLLLLAGGLCGAGAEAAATPPKITILKAEPGVAAGLIFIAPKGAGIGGGHQPGPVGPEIIDNHGRVVWFSPITNGQIAADFRVQSYRGRPVLTWGQQKHFGQVAQGTTVDYILDESYHVVATVRAGDGLNADAHEFLLTPRGTALITIYDVVSRDLSSVGGRRRGKVVEGSVQEVDVATGKVVFAWHSLDDVGLTESYAPLPKSKTAPWDYIHINAVKIDTDGNLLVSGRHTSAVYKLDRHTGRLIWKLGGKKSNFRLGTGARFWFQHDTIASGANTLRIFDNEVNPKPVLPYSRVIWLKLDAAAKTATLIRALRHPDGVSAVSQGNAQRLENGDTFVGWGQPGRFSEFDAKGRLIFDATVPKGYDTYRAYRFRWPVAAVSRTHAGTREAAGVPPCPSAPSWSDDRDPIFCGRSI
jgi:outer membrane protein assembly factor BamB